MNNMYKVFLLFYFQMGILCGDVGVEKFIQFTKTVYPYFMGEEEWGKKNYS